MQITDDKEFIEKFTRLLIHVGADMTYLLVIPRNELLGKTFNFDGVRKLLQDQSDSALKSFLQHIPCYEKSLEEVFAYDISSFSDFELLGNHKNRLILSVQDIKKLYDINLLNLKNNEQPEVKQVMAFLEKAVSRLTEMGGILTGGNHKNF